MIAGLSEIRRLPRRGILRIGAKVATAGGKERPKALDHFVTAGLPEVAAIYGPKPTAIDVLLPFADPAACLDVHYKAYRQGGKLVCKGNGQAARRAGIEDGKPTLTDVPCVCPWLEKGDCKAIGTLTVILPRIDMMAAYQIVTASWNSTINLQTGIARLWETFGAGMIAIPLRLTVRPHTGRPIVDGKQIASTVFVLSLEGLPMDKALAAAGRMREAAEPIGFHALPAPVRPNAPPDPDEWTEGTALVARAIGEGPNGKARVFPDDYPAILEAAIDARVNEGSLRVLWNRAGQDEIACLAELRKAASEKGVAK